MEAILNILWVLIALAALSVWRVCWSRDRRDGRRNPVREWTAIACALILLFFAVSLTDDLHYDLALFDECAGVRRHLAVWTAPHGGTISPSSEAASSAAISPKLPLIHVLEVTARLERAEQSIPGFLASASALGRAPPVSFL